MKPKSGQDAIDIYVNNSAVRPTMSLRPEFYSGCGVRPDCFNDKHLVVIHAGLIKDFGAEAGAEFCRMIDGLEDLSTTNFLNQFYLFFARGMVWQQGNESGIDVGPDDGYRNETAMFSIIGAMNGSSARDSMLTSQIRRGFFERIGYKSSREPQNRTSLDGTMYYRNW